MLPRKILLTQGCFLQGSAVRIQQMCVSFRHFPGVLSAFHFLPHPFSDKLGEGRVLAIVISW